MRNNHAGMEHFFRTVFTLVGVCVVVSTEATEGSFINKIDRSIECIAHRGYASAVVPENTVEAIKRAYDFGADWVETDFNLMPDGRVLCFHDPKKRDAVIRPPYHVPTMEEVLAVVPKDRHIQCEIKTYGPEYPAKFDAAVQSAGLTPENIIVSCFKADILKDFKRQMPRYRTLWLIGLTGMKKDVTVEELIATAKDIGVFAMCPGANSTSRLGWTRADADKIRAAGFSFRLYGANSSMKLAHAAELGADAVTCNYFEDAYLWGVRKGVKVNPKKAKTINLTAAFPEGIRTIGIVMPASIVRKKAFDKLTGALSAAGYRLKFAPRMNFDKVASAEDRAKDFADMWMDPEVDLVLCARGGKGSEDILPFLDWNRLRTRKQRVLGFSNITRILNAMLKEQAGEPFSGPTLSQFRYCDMPTLTWLNISLARSKMPEVKLRPLRAGACEGPACGGHLTIFLSAVKAGQAPSAKGRIVFLECVNTRPEAVEAALDKLIELGYFADAAGVVLGELAAGDRDGKDGHAKRSDKAKIEEISKAFAEKVACPVFDGYPYGHVPRSFTIDFNRRHVISADGKLTFHD